MSKAAELAALIGSQTALSNRNLIINGAMQVAQRGTSFNNISSDTFVVDRFFVGHGSVTPNVSQQSVAVGGETGLPTEFTKFARCDYDVNGGSNLGITTRFEDTEKYVGTHTVSFYAKGTNPTGGQMAVRFIQRFGSGGSSQVIVDPSSPLFTLTSNWQRFSVTVTLPSVSGKTLGSGRYLQLQITQPNADSGTGAFLLDITGVQLEVGEQATPFEHRSFGDELQSCLRYYEQWDADTGGRFFGVGYQQSSTSSKFIVPFSVQKRAAPSITFDAGGDNNDFLVTRATSSTAVSGTETAVNVGVSAFQIDLSSNPSSATGGQGSFFGVRDSARVQADAEL